MTTDEIIAARTNGQSFGSVPAIDRRDALDGFLKRLYAMKGYPVADPSVQPEIDIAVRELDERIVRRWSALTLGEVWLALDSGVMGDFGKDTRLSVSNYLAWLTAYTRSDERKEVIMDSNRRHFGVEPTKVSHQLTGVSQQQKNDEADRLQLRIEWINFKKEGQLNMLVDGCAACLCDYLIRVGKLNARPETLEKARIRGRKRVQRKRRFGSAYSQVINSGKDEEILETLATKHELLAMYFESLKARGLELQV